jgi:disulfide bond formation protein DsbB
MLAPFLDSPRRAGLAIVLVSAAALAAALIAQYWGGLRPCVLCHYQRYAYVAALLAGLAALLLGGAPRLGRLAIAAAGLAFLTGAGIAAFHVGVEQHWWRGTAACHAPDFNASLSVAELREQLMNTDFVACDQIPWELFGISIAGFNLLASLGLAALTFWALATMVRRRAG